jgi:Cd2+/Zn2+-exporting ATPase
MAESTFALKNPTAETTSASRPMIRREKIEAIFVVVTAVAIGTSLLLERLAAPTLLILAVNIISYIAGGTFGLIGGLQSLRRREIDVDILMVLAAAGAALINQWHEGATLLFLFSLSNVLQNYAMDRSRNAIRALLKLRPETATVRRDGQVVTVATSSLLINDVVVIHPGERLPIDGVVIAGTSTIDQAPITGESVPVTKGVDDEVFAGTVNQNGTLDVRMTRTANETTLSRIINLVEQAQNRRADTQRFLDEFEQRYALFVIVAVGLYIVIPPLLPGGPTFSRNFYHAMVLMTVASPCALVISTPASILSAIANAARRGILFKGGAYLEQMGGVRAIAFDKTGTITSGKLAVTDVVPMDGISVEQLLQTAAVAENLSEHPIAKAVAAKAREQKLEVPEPDSFENVPGQGVRTVWDGSAILVGTERLMEGTGLTVPAALSTLRDRLENEGKTVLLAYGGPQKAWLGAIGVADQLRPNAAAIIQKLREAGIQRIAILTGDNQTVAQSVAKQVNADDVFAELLPENKVDAIKALKAKYGTVAMVGDGVNDAPALAEATIGIAMGAAGTDVALETADVVLMADDLLSIAYAIKLSRKARRIVMQNLTFSLGVIVVLLISALGLNPLLNATGTELPLPLGVIAHEGSTIIVVLNGIRLLVENDVSLGLLPKVAKAAKVVPKAA